MFVTIAVGVALVVLWVAWLNDTMGGGGKRQVAATRTPVLALGGAAEGVRATPYQLGGKRITATPLPTPSPHPTATATPVRGTATPTPAPTPVPPTATPVPTAAGDRVRVQLSTYWPDDGPDWCLTWDDERAVCVSPLTSGDAFRAYDGRAFACDGEWLGHVLVIPALGLALPCLDTGVSFECPGGPCTVGLLASGHPEIGGMYDAILQAR